MNPTTIDRAADLSGVMVIPRDPQWTTHYYRALHARLIQLATLRPSWDADEVVRYLLAGGVRADDLVAVLFDRDTTLPRLWQRAQEFAQRHSDGLALLG